ncbi:DUF397 domain-containing protein [Streptomyces sp. NPDC094034]|uniref:DUF397 domain-containing protein n=1 Tax=Streptomyces sp. NPDC094034 TaxID=3155309 RepID=UPI003318A8C2
MTPHLTSPHVWHRSSYSTGANNCVECAPSDAGGLTVRDSKEVTRPHLSFSADAWTSFVSALCAEAPTH